MPSAASTPSSVFFSGLGVRDALIMSSATTTRAGSSMRFAVLASCTSAGISAAVAGRQEREDFIVFIGLKLGRKCTDGAGDESKRHEGDNTPRNRAASGPIHTHVRDARLIKWLAKNCEAELFVERFRIGLRVQNKCLIWVCIQCGAEQVLRKPFAALILADHHAPHDPSGRRQLGWVRLARRWG